MRLNDIVMKIIFEMKIIWKASQATFVVPMFQLTSPFLVLISSSFHFGSRDE